MNTLTIIIIYVVGFIVTALILSPGKKANLDRLGVQILFSVLWPIAINVAAIYTFLVIVSIGINNFSDWPSKLIKKL